MTPLMTLYPNRRLLSSDLSRQCPPGAKEKGAQMRFPRLSKANLARIALAVVWVFAVEALTIAGSDLVRITSPANGQKVKGSIRVEAQTTIDDAAYLIFRLDGRRPHSTNVRPYYYELDTTALADGPHALAVEVYGRAGVIAESAPVKIEVVNGGALPTATAQVAPATPAGAKMSSVAATTADPPAPSPSQSAVGEDQAPAAALILGPQAVPTLSRSANSTQRKIAPAAAEALAVADAESPTLYVRSEHAVPPQLTVVLDGRELAFEVPPGVEGGRAYGPLRRLIEGSGGAVNWLSAAKQAIAKRAGVELRVTIGASEAQLDGRAVDLGAAPRLSDGRTVVPLRAACEPLGLKVTWSADSRTVRLHSADAPVQVGALLAR